MENKKKIIGYKQPFEIEVFNTKKNHLWRRYISRDGYYINESDSRALPKEIVEQWEPVYEEMKLEDLPKVNVNTIFSQYSQSTDGWRTFMKNTYPNGVIILPDNIN